MEKTKLRQYPPCSIYDTGKIEQWLEDLALEGWQLTDISVFCGHFCFEKAPPQVLHYRLEVVVNPQSGWDGDPKTPREEALALHEEFGWEFVLRHGEFFLYKSTESQPRELHTDPEIQAMILKKLNRRLLSNAFFSILLAGFQIAFGAFGYPFSILLLFGLTFVLAFLAVTLFQLWELLHAIRLILRQRRILLGKASPTQQHSWRTGARRYRILQISGTVFSCLFLVFLFTLCIIRKTDTPMAEFTGTIPFVTIDSLDSDGSHGTLGKIDNATCSQWETLLYPLVIDYLDGGSVTEGPQLITGGLLEVQYCEAITPWLAQGAARDFARFYDRQPIGINNAELRPLPQLGLDYAVGLYHETFGLLRVVLSEGNRTICARFSMDDETGPYTIEYWTECMAQQLLS